MGKPKKLPYQLIGREETFLSGQPYELLDEIRAEHHFDTAEAKIALAWKKGTKPDADGRLVLGRCHKLSDLQRELADYDFVISLNQEVWEDPEFGRAKKLALLDHEMCHAARAVDGDGEPKIDTKGRPVWRLRGHEIEEFSEIVARHGTYKRDLEKFASALLERKCAPLLAAVPAQSDLPLQAQAAKELQNDPEFLAAADRLTSALRGGGIDSLTISGPGMEPVVIDKRAAKNIHERAKKARAKHAKDPG